ncbi:tetratricopeptide repeat protein [Vibrio parahaemolyticus]|nr:tetratricopeptide repeat protein [Vibrio parahaemolyticus]EGR2933615.1 tetratricopeptide repeat protein [Vibrio parahaemolyticus]EGR2958261.1 tetratricopeptide repeat protein [Vibrio parahaemolyticus]EGR2962932.1 tetratricopeptide repeat protein [Vibrio parahaemolyticus]EGR2967980.1 tetratricopeptide repeat protein [Vibrio parahaemolyticus]
MRCSPLNAALCYRLRKEIQELSFLIFTEPNNYKHYYERGILYGGEHIKSIECRESDYHGDYSQAIEDFDKVIELQPNFANAYYHKACIYFELDIDDDEAESLLEKALALEPNNSAYTIKYAEVITYHGENGDIAAELLEKVLVQDYSADNCILSAGYLLQYASYDFLIGNDVQALQTYQKAMKRLQHAVEKDNEYLEHATNMWSDFAEGCGYDHESIKNGSSLLLPQISVWM